MITDEQLGAMVRSLRKAAKISQEELQARLQKSGLNWSQGTLSRVETGSRPMRFVEAVVVANALGVTVDDLYTINVRRQALLAQLGAADAWLREAQKRKDYLTQQIAGLS